MVVLVVEAPKRLLANCCLMQTLRKRNMVAGIFFAFISFVYLRSQNAFKKYCVRTYVHVPEPSSPRCCKFGTNV